MITILLACKSDKIARLFQTQFNHVISATSNIIDQACLDFLKEFIDGLAQEEKTICQAFN